MDGILICFGHDPFLEFLLQLQPPQLDLRPRELRELSLGNQRVGRRMREQGLCEGSIIAIREAKNLGLKGEGKPESSLMYICFCHWQRPSLGMDLIKVVDPRMLKWEAVTQQRNLSVVHSQFFWTTNRRLWTKLI